MSAFSDWWGIRNRDNPVDEYIHETDLLGAKAGFYAGVEYAVSEGMQKSIRVVREHKKELNK
jgi:hypothetical protein